VPREAVPGLKQHLEANGVKALVSPRLRLVTHLDVDAAAIDRAVSVFAVFFQKAVAAAH
jgi:threonine aldolase